MVAGLTHFDADGKSVTLPITATVVKNRVVVVDGEFYGIDSLEDLKKAEKIFNRRDS